MSLWPSAQPCPDHRTACHSTIIIGLLRSGTVDRLDATFIMPDAGWTLGLVASDLRCLFPTPTQTSGPHSTPLRWGRRYTFQFKLVVIHFCEIHEYLHDKLRTVRKRNQGMTECASVRCEFVCVCVCGLIMRSSGRLGCTREWEEIASCCIIVTPCWIVSSPDRKGDDILSLTLF